MNRARPIPAVVGGKPTTTRSKAARARSLAGGWALRLESTPLGTLWSRLLEVEFVDRSVALAAKLFVTFFPLLIVAAAVVVLVGRIDPPAPATRRGIQPR